MASIVSPGVYTREIDLSLYAPQLSSTIVGMVGTATKGPMNTPTLITNLDQLISRFGNPDPNHLMIYAAAAYLRRGRQLYITRVGSNSAAKASVAIRDESGTTTGTAYAKSEGTWSNGYKITISTGTQSGTFKLQVKDPNGRILETHDRLVKSTSSPFYWEDYVSRNSTIIDIDDDTTNSNPPKNDTFTLSGGDDGLTGISNSTYIGVSSGTTVTGLQTFRNPETIDVNLLCVPGVSAAAVINEGIAICEERGDCLYIADPPFGLDAQNVVDWHNGAGAYNDHSAFNSSYGALYWPWLQIYDAYSDSNIWVPPSGEVVAAMAYNDYVADPWFAPAGFNRGRLIVPLKVEYSATQGERDLLYSGGNAVNPIVNFTRDGITIWGQRTLQRSPTALDRVNVRRMMLQLRKIIASAVRYITFEPNDAVTWRRFTGLTISAIEPMKRRRGIYDYRIVCDETTNLPEYIDRNEMHGKIFIKPTKTAEIIVVDFVLMPTGARFEEMTGA